MIEIKGSVPDNNCRPVSGSLPLKKSIMTLESIKYFVPIRYGFALRFYVTY